MTDPNHPTTDPSDPTDNIIAIVNSLSSEENKLVEEELAHLFKYLTYKDNATLARVEKYLVSSPNSITKLLYLRALLEDGMFLQFVFSVIFANNTEYLHNLVLFFPAFYCQTRRATHCW
jgi:hypothetical protein